LVLDQRERAALSGFALMALQLRGADQPVAEIVPTPNTKFALCFQQLAADGDFTLSLLDLPRWSLPDQLMAGIFRPVLADSVRMPTAR
jgi:hypothetical protein